MSATPKKFSPEWFRQIAATGGKAGRGAKKLRGTPEYYAEMGRRGVASRKAKKEKARYAVT